MKTKNDLTKYPIDYEQTAGSANINKNTIIHISGFPGSGKSTLGDLIEKKFGKKVVVYDTDNFIQHHTKEGKQLLHMEKLIDQGTKTIQDYKKLWLEIISSQINKFISGYSNKIIVFVGSLDNFAPPDTIYNIQADYKYLLYIPLDELMKRYYLRIYLEDVKRTKEKSNKYWKNMSESIYHISGSDQIIKEFDKYNQWHKKSGYEFLSDNQIISKIKNIHT